MVLSGVLWGHLGSTLIKQAASILGLDLFSPLLSTSEDRARIGPGMSTAETVM